MTNKELIKDCFVNLLESPQYRPEVIATYFSTDYIQCVDGKKLDYTIFSNHIKKLKEVTERLSITFNYMAEEGNLVFTNHSVSVYRNDGSVSKVKVIATFVIENEKIVFCDELTLHEEGNHDDSNLGSMV
ncbi:hypothetical protein HMPREF9713_03502 [Myroides odoratimimus CCUG 12700]|uniref:hypothetical protein n=1 Tax=Myroides odoratimimus TaxID=76832 RepID=UPI0003534AC3|nr:hypothetical protein [Myroides odoratimimus]EPH06642.1 hypothetical protein HMPREF9713_03502 [Myroides odoratimimus CCUG 12700]SHM12265.1 hypothetical protein SAMN05444275_10998 [Myroides odoratimimus subsp. xuanwuensis]